MWLDQNVCQKSIISWFCFIVHTLQLLSCYTLGATVRTVRGEKCRKLPTCLEPTKDESRGVGSSLINLRSGAEPDVNCQLPKRKVNTYRKVPTRNISQLVTCLVCNGF